jgi:hypothetical protein
MKKPLFYKNHILVKPFRKLLARFWDLVTAVLLASVFLALDGRFLSDYPPISRKTGRIIIPPSLIMISILIATLMI